MSSTISGGGSESSQDDAPRYVLEGSVRPRFDSLNQPAGLPQCDQEQASGRDGWQQVS